MTMPLHKLKTLFVMVLDQSRISMMTKHLFQEQEHSKLLPTAIYKNIKRQLKENNN